jgi:hypothetical protein
MDITYIVDNILMFSLHYNSTWSANYVHSRERSLMRLVPNEATLCWVLDVGQVQHITAMDSRRHGASRVLQSLIGYPRAEIEQRDQPLGEMARSKSRSSDLTSSHQ